MASVAHRPALALRPTNASLAANNTRSVSGTKRTRDDDTDDVAETRGSAKRSRVDVVVPAISTNIFNKESKTPKLEKPVDVVALKTGLENKPTAGTATAEKRAEKEKSRAARLAAEEDFRLKYRNAFPAWKFYFDGVSSGAVASATRKIQALGATVQDFLTKGVVTHFIVPTKLEKENDLSQKPLSVSHPTSSLRSPADLKGVPLERAKEWNLKIWDISKLESVLDRTLARPSKPEEQVTLESFLGADKAAGAATPLPPSLKHLQANQVAALARPAPRPQVPQGFTNNLSRRPANPYTALNPQKGIASHNQKVFSKMKNPSTALAGLLATEKATHMTMERDPNSKRHDYTYFAKGAAFVIVEVVGAEFQLAGRLEYRATKAPGTRVPSVEIKGSLAQNYIGGNANGMALPEYPILYMDPRMRSPFAPYNPKTERKERIQEIRDREDKESRQGLIKLARAEKALIEKATTGNLPGSKGNPFGTHNLPVTPGRRTVKEFPTGSTDVDHPASGFIRSMGCDSLSTAGGGPPTTTTSHFTTSMLSQSGGGGSWATNKLFGVGGFVPGFGGASGVKKATQVVMRRGAFAEVESEAAVPTGTGASVHARGMARTNTMPPATQTQNNNGRDATGFGEGLRRTKSLVSIRKDEEEAQKKEKEKEKNKKPEGYCECCKEHYEHLGEHIKSRKHRKFATDPRRYKELDMIINRLKRVPRVQRLMVEETKSQRMLASRERWISESWLTGSPRVGVEVEAATDNDNEYATEPDTSNLSTSTANTSSCITPIDGPEGGGASFGDFVASLGGKEVKREGEKGKNWDDAIVISSDAPSLPAEETKSTVQKQESFEFPLPLATGGGVDGVDDVELEITDVPEGWTR